MTSDLPLSVSPSLASAVSTWLAVGILLIGVACWIPQALLALTAGPGIEPTEGSTLELGLSIMRGENPYPDPTTDNAKSGMYPPLAPLLFALAWHATGKTMLGPRVVSLVALLAIAMLLGAFVLEVRGWGAALACAGAWITVQPWFMDFLVLARIDALAIFFTLGALLLGERHAAGRAPAWPAALLSVLAVYTKQTAVVAPLAVLLAVLMRRGSREAIRFLTMTAVPGAMIALALHAWSDGWSTTSLFLGRRHPLVWSNALPTLKFHFGSIPGISLTIFALLGAQYLGARAWVFAWAISLPLGILSCAKLFAMPNSLAFTTSLGLALAFVKLAEPEPARSAIRSRVAHSLLLPAFAIVLVLAARSSFPGWVIFYHPTQVAETRKLIQQANGPIFMARFQEFLQEADRPIHDDLYQALEYSISGYPALPRLTKDVEAKRYELIFTPRDIATWLNLLRQNGRAEQASEIQEFLDAVDQNYHMEPLNTLYTAFRRHAAERRSN